MPIRFEVSSVSRAKTSLRMPRAVAPLRLQGRPVEAMGATVPVFLPARGHGLIQAVHTAYALHYPLVLTPDVLWLAIAQGLALHVNANAERLRGKFVRHDGKVTISIERHDFVKGSPHNQWSEVLSVFSDAVAAHVGRQRDLVVCDFTTTSACERTASEVVLLDMLQSYFDYDVLTLCGIPEITLEGTADDWRAIRRRARALDEYELAWWTDPLGEVLDKLVATAEGRVDVGFWRAFFKKEDGSGGPWVCGWINVLFPYLRTHGGNLERNGGMGGWKERFARPHGGGATLAEISSGLSRVPFVWRYFGERLPMEFLAGFVGLAQDDETLAVRPAIGWAVRNAHDPVKTVEEPTARHERPPRIESEASLVAGRMTVAIQRTGEEAAALCASVESLGRASGIRLSCVPAGDVEAGAEFPEFPLTLRLVIGIRVAAVPLSGSRRFDVNELRDALDAAGGISSATWRAICEIVSVELDGSPRIYLAISGSRLSGALRFGFRIQVAEVRTTGPDVVELDVSPPTHDARLVRARDLGVSEEAAAYTLEASYLPWARRSIED